MEDNVIVITEDNKEDLFLQMRHLAYAQLMANYILGMDAPPEEKEDFVKNFNIEEIDTVDFEEISPALVFEQYFNMFKEPEKVDGYPAIKESGMYQAVNKLIYYGFMKTYSRMCDEGLVDMYCLPDGDFCFVPKGTKPRLPPQQHQALEKKEDKPTFRVKIKAPKKSKKKPTKKPASKKTNKRKKKKPE